MATGPVPPDSGYLFGGLFTSKVENPVTRAASCPPSFFPLIVGDKGDLHVCISDDYEFGEEYSLPFAGFISCVAGNPLSVAHSTGQGQAQNKAKAAGLSSKSQRTLKRFFEEKAQKWPMRCPDGYSRHLATVDQGCQINYCVRLGAMAGPVLSPIKRPPFVSAPPVLIPPSDNVVIFDPATNTWAKNEAAVKMMKLTSADTTKFEHSQSSRASWTDTWTKDEAAMAMMKLRGIGTMISDDSRSSGDTSGSMSPGTAAGISFGATLGCIVLATLAVMAVRARRRRRGQFSYRRLPNPLLEPQDNYGSVRGADSQPISVRVEVTGENGQ